MTQECGVGENEVGRVAKIDDGVGESHHLVAEGEAHEHLVEFFFFVVANMEQIALEAPE